jgi:hypothetical protein
MPNQEKEGQLRWLSPGSLLLGAVSSFVGCCLVGRLAAAHDHFADVHRFHRAINPQTLFYPTASQVRALGHSRLDRNKVAVIVGGNSVLYGAGQRVQELWARHLQAELGDDYRVLNLALPGCRPAEFGGTAAEMLGQDFPRLIFVTDVLLVNLTARLPPGASTGADQTGIPLGATYDYFFWDAYSKGLLATSGQRAEAVRKWASACRASAAFAERERGVAADRLTYSRDLWTALAHDSFSTVWAPPPAPAVFTWPRRHVADVGNQLGDFPPEVYRAFDAGEGVLTNLRQEVVQGRRLLRTCARGTGGAAELDQAQALVFPPGLRQRTLLLAVPYGPRCVRQLGAQEQADYRAALAALVRGAGELGFAALEVGAGYGEDDFVESCHLSESGGKKLAAEVAPAVRRLARRLGYTASRPGGRGPRGSP